MDFECIDYMLKRLDISKLAESKLYSIRKRASHYKLMHNRIYCVKGPYPVLVPTLAER